MSQLLLIAVSIGIVSIGSPANADHVAARASVHLSSGVELGPRLSARIDTKIPAGEPIRTAPGEKGPDQADHAKNLPQRKVRVVYPGPAPLQ